MNSKVKLKLFITLIFLISTQFLFSQVRTRIEGKITDAKNNPLPYVNAFLLNTTDGAMSDDEGNFSFASSEKGKAILMASIVGYEKFQSEIDLAGEKISINITLNEKAVNLKEAVVTGSSYGSEKEKLGLYFDFRQSFTKPIFWLNGGADRLVVTPVSKNVTGGIVYSYSQTGRLKLFGIIADDEQGVKVERAEYTGTFSGNSKNYFANLQNTDILLGIMVMKNSISYNKYSNEWKLGLLDLTKTDYVYSFRNDFEVSVSSSNKVLFGGEYESRKVNFLGKIPEEDFNIKLDGQVKVIDASFSGGRFGMYAELQSANPFSLNNFSFTAGVRYDGIAGLNLSWIDPRASFGYRLSDKSTLKFGWGIFHQLPDPRLFQPVDGNPNLKSMRAEHFILSYDYSIDEQNSFRLELYHKKYNDLPKENSVLNYDNSGSGFANGADVILKGNLPLNINGWISYGFINTKRFWMDFDKLTSSSFDITHNLTLVLKYNLSDSWQIGVNAKYATGRPYTPIVSSQYRDDLKIYEPVYALTNSNRYPDYKRVDVRLTYFNQLFGNVPFVAYMEGLNVMNFNNIFGYTYSADYSDKKEIQSYFGRRMLVFGFMVTL